MAELILTQADIAADIEAYQARIQSARDRLKDMQADMATASTYKEQKRLKTQRRTLQYDINHVYRILAYAEAALLECQEKKEDSGNETPSGGGRFRSSYPIVPTSNTLLEHTKKNRRINPQDLLVIGELA
jgi:septal ring factor EnvC (AmiA/AmiB activator)